MKCYCDIDYDMFDCVHRVCFPMFIYIQQDIYIYYLISASI